MLFLATLGFSLSARADIVLTNETSIGEVKSTTTMYVSGGKVRTDNDTTSSAIIDTDTGEMITLIHEQKMVVRVDTKKLTEGAAAPLPKQATAAATTPTITATGKHEKVDGYDCEIVTSELGGMQTKMWIAKDYPGYDKLRKELSVMDKISAGAAKPSVNGMCLKTEWEQQGLKFTTKLVSLKEEKVDPARFTVPAGYKAPGE